MKNKDVPRIIEIGSTMYADRVRAGKITIEEVPEAFREETQSLLEPT